MIRSLVTGLVGFVAGWVLVPSLLSLKWELDGFTGSTSTLAVVGYVILCALCPLAVVAVGLWLDRVWIGLVALGIGVVTSVVMLGIFA